MTSKKLSPRTAERLIRAAYDYEELANRLKHDGHNYFADSVRAISSQLGVAGRTMLDAIEAQKGRKML